MPFPGAVAVGADSLWQPLAEQAGAVAVAVARGEPCVFRQRACHWPAVAQWSWERLAQLAPDMPVRLVQGNCELGTTVFQRGTLGAYLRSLPVHAMGGGAPMYLKEFDLLRVFPHLRGDVHPRELLPPKALHDSRQNAATRKYERWSCWRRQPLHVAHMAGLWRRGHCTCHPAQ